MIRKLTTLAKGFYNPGKWYVSFAHYKQNKFGALEWTGDSEGCEFTEDELYEIIKFKLKADHTELLKRR